MKGDKNLEDKEHSDWPSKVDNDQLRAITEEKLILKEPNINHSTVVQHLKQIGKVKKLDKWVLRELTKD